MKNCKDELYRIRKSYNDLKNKLMFAEKEIEKANKRAETFEFLAKRLAVAIDCPRCPVKGRCGVPKEDLYSNTCYRSCFQELLEKFQEKENEV